MRCDATSLRRRWRPSFTDTLGVAERNNRIDPGRAPRRNQGGDECRRQQHDSGSDVRGRTRGGVQIASADSASASRISSFPQVVASERDGPAVVVLDDLVLPEKTRGSVEHCKYFMAFPSLTAQTVGTVPPSMTYSAPVIDAARDDARKATRNATSSGLAGRPMGIPPSESIKCFRAPS